MIKTSITRKLENFPAGHSDHVMFLRLPIQDKFATVLSVYTPTLQAETGVKEAFYRDLHNLLQQVDSKDKLNARVGLDFELWKGVLGTNRIGNCNDNGYLLLEFCSEHQLVINKTLFQHKDRFNAT